MGFITVLINAVFQLNIHNVVEDKQFLLNVWAYHRIKTLMEMECAPYEQ